MVPNYIAPRRRVSCNKTRIMQVSNSKIKNSLCLLITWRKKLKSQNARSNSADAQGRCLVVVRADEPRNCHTLGCDSSHQHLFYRFLWLTNLTFPYILPHRTFLMSHRVLYIFGDFIHDSNLAVQGRKLETPNLYRHWPSFKLYCETLSRNKCFLIISKL